MVPTRRRVLVSVAASLLVAGCSSEDADPAPTGSPTQPSTTVTLTPTPTVGATTRPPRTTSRSETTSMEPQRTVNEDQPEYVDPDVYSETELSLAGPGARSLGATLSLPDGSGTVPGVVIVHGSGPHDRDGSIGPLAPYRDIARGLATRGIAALRYDKRTLATGRSSPTRNSPAGGTSSATDRTSASRRIPTLTTTSSRGQLRRNSGVTPSKQST